MKTERVMKFQKSQKFIGLWFLMAIALVNFSCQKQTVEGEKAQTPTQAYQMLFNAVKAKDTEKVKQVMSKNTLALAESQAQRQNQTIEKTLENGLLATTITDKMPQIRDERIKDDFGAVEVYNQKESKWEDTFFINEDGGWKLAIGDAWQGIYKSPGKSKAQQEKEISNSATNNMMLSAPNTNANISSGKNSSVPTMQVTPENKPKK